MRKFLLFILAVLAINTVAKAQTESGRFILGGTFNINSSKNKDQAGGVTVKTDGPSGFAIIPNFGYFFADNIAAGIGIGFQQDKDPFSAGIVNTVSQFIVAPWLRYYMPTSGERFFFFAQFRPAFGFGKFKTETTPTGGVTVSAEEDFNSLDIALSPGFAFFPSDRWSIEFLFRGIAFSSSTLKEADGDKTTTSTVVFDLRSFSPSLGVNIFF